MLGVGAPSPCVDSDLTSLPRSLLDCPAPIPRHAHHPPHSIWTLSSPGQVFHNECTDSSQQISVTAPTSQMRAQREACLGSHNMSGQSYSWNWNPLVWPTQLCYASPCPRLCGSLWLSRPDPSPLVSILFQCDFILPALPPAPGLSQATSFALGTPDLGHSLPSDVVFLCPPGITQCHQIREVLPACGPLSNSCWLYIACGSGVTWAFVYMAVCPPSWSGGPTRVWPRPV